MPKSDPTQLTLYIVDDDKVIRESLVLLFASRGHRVQTFPSGEAFLASAPLHLADCVVLDRRMGDGLSGLQVHDELLRQASPMVVVFLSGHGDIPTAMESTKHKGAFDWLVKGMPDDELVDKVEAALKFARERKAHLLRCAEVAERWKSLTPREADVARRVRHGWANQLVADELGIGVRSVESHRAHVYSKLWVSNPTELDRLMRDHQIE